MFFPMCNANELWMGCEGPRNGTRLDMAVSDKLRWAGVQHNWYDLLCGGDHNNWCRQERAGECHDFAVDITYVDRGNRPQLRTQITVKEIVKSKIESNVCNDKRKEWDTVPWYQWYVITEHWDPHHDALYTQSLGVHPVGTIQFNSYVSTGG